MGQKESLMLAPSPFVSKSDCSPVPPTDPIRVYVVTYLTSFWPHALAPPLHPVYSEQYDGLIGVYSGLENAKQAGTIWLDGRTKEMEQADPEDASRPGETGRKTWVQRGWSQVLEKGALYEIWVNGIDPGVSKVIVKIRASAVCGLAQGPCGGIVTDHAKAKGFSMSASGKKSPMALRMGNLKPVTPGLGNEQDVTRPQGGPVVERHEV